jgi:hypothetical protein
VNTPQKVMLSRRCAVATLPEIVSVTTRRGSTLKPAAWISWIWLSVVWLMVETRTWPVRLSGTENRHKEDWSSIAGLLTQLTCLN